MKAAVIFLFYVLSLLAGFESRACFILFLKDGNNILVGNHEDWFANDAAIKINSPSEGKFGSVIFTFLSEGWAQGGMNEKGLFFDAAYTPYQEITFNDHVSKFSGYIWQAMLDRCSTVEEALAFLQKYELSELKESHILLADASGNAVIIGVKNEKLAIKKAEGNYLMQTNFNPWHPELSDEPVCIRYETAKKHLISDPEVSINNMKRVLMETHQDSLTVYSNIYDLKNRKIYTYNKRNFNKAIEVSLPDIFRVGSCAISLDSLEKNGNSYWNRCLDMKTREVIISGKVYDSKTGAPLAYTSIGLSDRNIGTLSDPDGSFELTIPPQFVNDSLNFSSIGFDRYKVLVSDIKKNPSIGLNSNSILLKEILITENKKFSIARLGWMGGKDGALPFDTVQGGGAVALLVSAPKSPVYVKKLQVRLMYNSKDTLRLRLHFFSYDSIENLPDRELLTQEIILKENKRFGWLRFDLSDYNIVLTEKKFLIGFEWIDDRQTRNGMLRGLREWEQWKKEQFAAGNDKVETLMDASSGKTYYKYHGNMMDWPGFKKLPPFTGLMIETGKHSKTAALKTFERKTSFGKWTEMQSTLNAVVTVSY